MERETIVETNEYVLESSALPDALAALRQAVYEQEMRGPAPSPFSRSPATIKPIDDLNGRNTGVIIMKDTVSIQRRRMGFNPKNVT